jgi:hypothetical protein
MAGVCGHGPGLVDLSSVQQSNRPSLVARHHYIILLVAILIVAGAARYCYLGKIPQGLYMDEAADGIDAARTTAQHDYRVFYPSDAGREGLWIILTSLSVRWFGHTVYAVRFWAPAAGLVTIMALYGLASRWYGRRVGLIAAWLMATNFCHIAFSRVGFRGILVPLFVVSAVYFLQAAWDTRGQRATLLAVLGGYCLGLGFYSYIPFRLMPVLAVLIFTAEWMMVEPRRGREIVRIFTVWITVGAIIALPLGIHFAEHPQDFSSRISQVSVWSSAHPVKVIVRNAIRSAWMFVGKGDENWRQNLRPFPELIYPVGLFFVIGAVLVFRSHEDRQRRVRHFLILGWLVLMLVPAVLSREGVPHSLRSIGALPAAILLAALGADRIFEKVQSRHALTYVMAAVIVAAGAVDLYRYFGIWGKSPEVQHAYQLPQLQVSQSVLRLPPPVEVLIAVEEPTTYQWKGNAVEQTKADGRTELLPLHAAIPMYIASERPKVAYVRGSELAGIDLTQKYGCDSRSAPSLVSLPQNALVHLPGCAGRVVFVRLTGED